MKMHTFWRFPPEIRRLVYSKLRVCDLKAFSACSTHCYCEVYEFLPDTAQIKISWLSLINLDTSALDGVSDSKSSPSCCSGSEYLCFPSGNPEKFVHFSPYLTPEVPWSNHANICDSSSLFRRTRKVTSIEIRHFDADFSFFEQDDDESGEDFLFEDPNGVELIHAPGYDKQRIVKNFKNILKLFDPHLVDTLRLRHFMIGCDEVFHLACRTFPNVKVLQLQRITYRECRLVCQFKNLTDLNLNSCELEDHCLISICRYLPKLTKLDIGSNEDITRAGMSRIGKLKDLKEFYMSDLNLEVHGIGEISKLTKLTKLDMNYCSFVDMDVAVSKLAKLRYLNELCMRKSIAVKEESPWNALAFGDDGIPYLCPCFLRKLDIRSCNLTDEGLEKLVANQENLSHLNISDTQVSDISPVAKLLLLKKLHISYLPVDDTELMLLKHLPSLEFLDLSVTNAFATSSPPPLHEFQVLTSVKCCYDEINDDDVLVLSRITNLREVDVSYCVDVTDLSLNYLGLCSSLEKLAVAKTSVTNIGMWYLTSTNLRSLNIARNLQLTDDCLEHLRAFKGLKILRCYKTKMTKSAVSKFHKDRPWVQVNRNIVQDKLY